MVRKKKLIFLARHKQLGLAVIKEKLGLMVITEKSETKGIRDYWREFVIGRNNDSC